MDSIYQPCEERLQVAKKKRVIRFSIPHENFNEETRLPLTPQGVEVLVAQGHEVVVESHAGREAQFSNEQYIEAGARIVHTHAEAFDVDVVVKISLPTEEELKYIKEGLNIICFTTQHRRSRKLYKELAAKKCNIIALDFLTDEGSEPIVMRCLGEIEGMLAITTAAHLLENTDGGKGVIIGGITAVPPTEVVILGTNMAAQRAARTALALGASVKIFGNQHADLQQMSPHLPMQVFTSVLHPQALNKAMASADVVIGTQNAPGTYSYVVNAETVKLMKHQAVIVDLNCNYGGRFETSHSTTIKNPTYEEYSVVHHCLNNISVLASHTSTIVVSDIITPIILNMVESGSLSYIIRENRHIANSVVMLNGITTNKYISDVFDTDYYDINLLLY